MSKFTTNFIALHHVSCASDFENMYLSECVFLQILQFILQYRKSMFYLKLAQVPQLILEIYENKIL